ncbi:unnamed protein product [Brassicogethes aeneus]|uniref:KAT8 regulatory NSL complex subunit 2 n=1 Tax=Brassicogethes aeneus TaxID=1431903 RepID=A0A9P0AWG6_BRAAE|nr:unnamed protein product [Brassicogethes aeneus]
MADQPRMQAPPENPFKIKPPLSTLAEQEAAAVLRAELEIELKNKKKCAYQPYECTQLTIDHYKYCLKHILQDKNAPYKQCSYVYSSSGKRCNLAAPKGDKKDYGYCSEHALKTTLTRNRQNSRYPPPHTAEVLLHSLAHYVKKKRCRTTSSSSTQHSDEGSQNPDDVEFKCTKTLDPFSEIDANLVYGTNCNDVLDVCSESESDVEASTYSSVWHDSHADSSDNESIDSEQEDVLKHANVYTAEEITLVTRDKLIRLQSLYIEQYRHLQYMLKEKRRKYLQSLKREKETCCNIYNQVRDNPKEQRLYKKLKAFNKYQRHYGNEAILSKRLHELRSKITEGLPQKPSNVKSCCFTEGGVKCAEKTLPLAKHCRKHILEDPNQVLFRACGKINADVECNTPVEAIFENTMCKLHMDIPVLRSYSQTRKDSESDMDDSLENTNLFNESDLTETVKTEMIDYKQPEIPKMETVPSQLFEESEDMDSSPFMKENVDFIAENLSIMEGGEPPGDSNETTPKGGEIEPIASTSQLVSVLEETQQIKDEPVKMEMETEIKEETDKKVEI